MKFTLKDKPSIFVIFGGTGDLAYRKLIPAIFNLYLDKWMPKHFAVIGNGRSDLTDAKYRKKLLEGVNKFSRRGKASNSDWNNFSENIFFQKADVNEAATYTDLKKRIAKFKKEWEGDVNVIFYLAVAPRFFTIISENIAKYDLGSDIEHDRLVIEKPFGHDLESARHLNHLLCGMFNEKQIYRIDHYLGKEAVQNIMAFRFANAILEPVWNRNYIDHVQISVSEQLGVEGRGGYYEEAGALRDMVQNHILQLVCLVAMEPPTNFEADEIRNRKADVLNAVRKIKPEEVSNFAVRGQYGPGWMEGEKVPGYREEEGVDPESNTETFAAFKLFIDNWRWQGIPFYLRTGKRMHQSASLISIQFKDTPHSIFPTTSAENWQQNRLVISIQPEMSIRLQIQAKRPGLDMTLNPVDMIFDYKGTISAETPEAYETLLLDTIVGDQTLFMRGDQVESAWDILMNVLNVWHAKKSLNFPNYSSDSWGPEIAEALIARDGFHWFTLPVDKKK